MFGKLKKKIRKMRDYADRWDTEDHGYVRMTKDGKLIPTNNIDFGELCLVKADFLRLIKFLDS